MADNAERHDPVYTVVRVHRSDDGFIDRLDIIEMEVTAKTQEKATDRVVESLPVEQRTGEFGAFLRRSLWSDEYEVEQVITTRKKSRQSQLTVAS